MKEDPMNESEWLTCTDPTLMLKCLHKKITTRKMLLFSVACCRRILHLSEDEAVKKAVDTIEKYADGFSSYEELRAAEAATGTWAMALDEAGEDIWAMGYSMSWSAWAMSFVMLRADKASLERITLNERQAQSSLLRDVFANPFRSADIFPSCFTLDTVRLAQAIYEKRAFHHLLKLADNLEQVGCDNQEMLQHCRHQGEHVRGCWVVDLILGKK
jgi:hypothetical protein